MDIKVITKNNLNELDMFNEYNTCVVYGKGPTFRNDLEKKTKELRCAINHSCNYLEEVDMLCCNDVQAIYDIDKNKLKNIKILLIPEYLHINNLFNINGYWKKSIYNHIKDYFNGYYIIYNLITNPKPNSKIITLDSSLTSTNNFIEFISKFTNIKELTTYGFGVINSKQYNNLFKINKNTLYNNERIEALRQHAIKTCKNSGINLKII